MEPLQPYYERVRLEEFGLAPGQAARQGERSRFARWSPAEVAILRWLQDARHRLVSPSIRLPYPNLMTLVAQVRLHFRMTRGADKILRKLRRLQRKVCLHPTRTAMSWH